MNAPASWARLLLVGTLGASLVTGCSDTADPGAKEDDTDAGSDSGGSTADAGTNLGWTGNARIENIFETSCSGCHGTQWSSCWNVQENASQIDGEVASGAMPRGATLASRDKTDLLSWLDAGASCSGNEPDGGGGGEGFPTLSGEVVAVPTP